MENVANWPLEIVTKALMSEEVLEDFKISKPIEAKKILNEMVLLKCGTRTTEKRIGSHSL